MVALLLAFYHWAGSLERGAFHVALGAIVVLNLGFYGLFRSGLNRRFRDPSLTLPQMLSATATLLYTMYYVGEARGAFLLLFLVILMFGVLRLSTRGLLAMGAIVLAGYALVIGLLTRFRPDSVSLRQELLQWIVLAFICPWFALMGGYIGGLQRKLRANLAELRATRELAVRDELTGVYNRRYLTRALLQEKRRSDRGGGAFCVCMMDLDHFKRVNDTFGHAVGDQVLRTFVREAQRELRASDHFGRFGGEEFLLILAQASREGAAAFAERIRRRIESVEFPGADGGLRVTVSIGIAEYCPGERVSRTLARADKSLYRAKAGGRNRVVNW